MISKLNFIIVILFSLTSVLGQNKLLLVKKNNSKKKYLSLERPYDIKTQDTVFLNKEIIGFTDSSVFIPFFKYSGKDTIFTYNRINQKGKDSVYQYKSPVYLIDTLEILFSQIQSIKKDWFKNRQWISPFAHLALGAALGVVALPFYAINEGAKGIKEWAVFEAVLIGISAPPIFIGTRKTKYDLNKKWILRTE